MNIVRDLSLHGNFNTELFNLLHSLPKNILFHNEHEVRQPLGIYSVSTLRVFKSFENITKELKKTNNLEELAKAHKELMDALMAYIDDGYHIMKSLFPKNSVHRDIIFADKWIKAVDKNIKTIIVDYQNQLELFRSRLALMVNKIKHNHARHCHVEIKSTFEKIKGYYIEGVNKEGTIIPNTEIHPPLTTGEYTATSFNWDIKNFLVDFYIISKLMARTIFKLVHAQHGMNLVPEKIGDGDHHNLISVLTAVSNIKDSYFPSEYDINFIPQIIVNKKDGVLELRKRAYQSHMKKLNRYGNYEVRTIFSGDGVSPSWGLPYF